MWISSLVYWISYFTSIIRRYQYLLKSRQIKTCPLSMIQQLHCPVEYISYPTWLLNLNIQQTLASHADSLCPRQGIFLPHNETATHQEPNSERLETLRDEPLFFFDGEGVGKFLGHEFIFVPPGGALIFSSQTQDLVSRRFLLHSFVLKGPLARFFFSSFKWAGIIFGKLPSPSPLKKMVKPLQGRVSCGLVLEVCFRFNSFLLCWKHATTSSRLEKPRGLRRAEIPTETKSWLTSF